MFSASCLTRILQRRWDRGGAGYSYGNARFSPGSNLPCHASSLSANLDDFRFSERNGRRTYVELFGRRCSFGSAILGRLILFVANRNDRYGETGERNYPSR